VLQQPKTINHKPFLDYTIEEGCLYHVNKLVVPQSEDHLILIRETHASSYGGHFRTAKTLLHLQCHFYWLSMYKHVEHFIQYCSLCSQTKPYNRKNGLYHPFLIPSHPWESIYIDHLSGLPTTLCKHNSIWVFIYRFSKMALFLH